MSATFSLLDLLAVWRERLFANRYLNAVIAAGMAVVPLSIIRGVIISASVILEFTGHTSLVSLLNQLQTDFILMVPVLMNAFVCLHWAAKNRLSFAHSLTIGIGTLLIITGLISKETDLLHHFSIPVAVLSGILSSRLYELISAELNGKTRWIESRYRFLISILVYFSIVLVAGSLAGLAGRSLLVWLGDLPLDSEAMFQPNDYLHGLYYLLTNTLPWFVGIHGHFLFPEAEQALVATTHENLAAWAAGQAQLNIVSSVFYDVWCNSGGTGNTLSMVIAILFGGCDRSRNLIGVSLPLSLFNINEPLIFGLPVVLNPLMIIPFVTVPVVTYNMAYLATSMNWIPHISKLVNWSTPPLMNAWLACDKSLAAVLFHVLTLVVGALIYYPFLNARSKRPGVAESEKLASSLENIQPVHQDMVPNNKHLSEERAWREARSSVDKLHVGGSFVLYFQPQVCIENHQITGAEALIRFCTKGGQILPPTFLKHFERLGLMSEIDFWVMEHTVNYIHESLQGASGLTISVNVSPQTLVDDRLFPIIDRILNRPLPPGCTLEFEITESQKVTDPDKVVFVLHELSKRGIRLALDDFGSGYSTLNYLTSYPLDKIKLDRSMVQGLVRPEGFNFLCQVVRLCKISRCALLIEGVETEDELMQAKAAGIPFCQGFFFHRPMSGSHFFELVSGPGAALA